MKAILNPFKPEFTIVIFIHYKPRIAVAILDLQWMNMTWSGWQMKKILLLLYSYMTVFVIKPPGFRKLSHSSVMWNDVLMHREGLKGWRHGNTHRDTFPQQDTYVLQPRNLRKIILFYWNINMINKWFRVSCYSQQTRYIDSYTGSVL